MTSLLKLGRVALLSVLGAALSAAAQTGGMQNGPFDGMSSEIVVPAAVRVDGKNGAFFQTDLWIRCQTVPSPPRFTSTPRMRQARPRP